MERDNNHNIIKIMFAIYLYLLIPFRLQKFSIWMHYLNQKTTLPIHMLNFKTSSRIRKLTSGTTWVEILVSIIISLGGYHYWVWNSEFWQLYYFWVIDAIYVVKQDMTKSGMYGLKDVEQMTRSYFLPQSGHPLVCLWFLVFDLRNEYVWWMNMR